MANAIVENFWFTQLKISTEAEHSDVTGAKKLFFAMVASTLVVMAASTTNAVTAHQTLTFSVVNLMDKAAYTSSYETESAMLGRALH